MLVYSNSYFNFILSINWYYLLHSSWLEFINFKVIQIMHIMLMKTTMFWTQLWQLIICLARNSPGLVILFLFQHYSNTRNICQEKSNVLFIQYINMYQSFQNCFQVQLQQHGWFPKSYLLNIFVIWTYPRYRTV